MRRLPRYSLLLALLLGAVWLFTPPRPLQTATLPDGTVMRLEKVTYGKEHRFAPGPGWRRLWGILRPSPGHGTATVTSEEGERIVFWITHPELGIAIGSPRVFFASGYDEHGCEVPADDVFDLLYELGWQLPAFPRRGREVTLRVFRSGSGTLQPVAEFTVPNPAPGPHPTWTPEPLPVLAEVGDLGFVLTEFETALPRATRWFGRDEPRRTQIQVETLRAGRPVPGWEPFWVRVEDATGNRWLADGRGEPAAPSPGRYTFWGELWPCESAWKMVVDMARTGAGAFTEAEQVTFATIPVRARDDQTPVELLDPERMLTWEGTPLHLLVRGVAGDESSPPGVWISLFAPYGAPNVYPVLLRAEADPGGLLELPERDLAAVQHRRDWQLGPPHGRMFEYVWGLPAPEGKPRSVTLTFAIQRAVTVEFLAAPDRAPAPGDGGG